MAVDSCMAAIIFAAFAASVATFEAFAVERLSFASRVSRNFEG